MENIKINLFIDANIWLSLFHFTNDDLEQFKKLKTMIGHGIQLFVPEQIRNEVYRNRENKIKDALDKFEKFDLRFPVYIKNYEEYEEFHRKFKDLQSQHKEWLRKVKRDITEQNSPADIVLREVFECIDLLPMTPELVNKGVMRYNIGNPPGKDRKYGDAINWETLLDMVPDGEDLFFVSADKDYASLYDENRFHPFLAQEWKDKKQSKIIFYKSLVEFFKNHVSEIQLRVESEKDDLIEALFGSGCFHETHRVIEKLAHMSGWSLRQIQDMCKAAIENKQVYWIITDEDVQQFFRTLLDSAVARDSDDEWIREVRKELEKTKETSEADADADDEWPF